MNPEVSFRAFCWAIIFGMGFHVGYGLISLIVELAQRALARS
jgi:hypothetical protein